MSVKFINYIRDYKSPDSLLAEIFNRFDSSQFPKKQRRNVQNELDPFERKSHAHSETRAHCIRVASLNEKVAALLGLDRKEAVIDGLLHDRGKILTPTHVLSKSSGWSMFDTQIIQKHVLDGFRILHNFFPDNAWTILYHHRYQDHPYPDVSGIEMPYPAAERKKIFFRARLLSLCDCYDAAHRIDGYKIPGATPGEGIREFMFQKNSDMHELLQKLYATRIFTTYTEPISE